MADEMLVLEGNRQGRYQVLMLFPSRRPPGPGARTSCRPRPPRCPPRSPRCSRPPSGAASTAARLPTASIAMKKAAGITPAQLATELRRVYAQQLTDFNAEYATRYGAHRHAGSAPDRHLDRRDCIDDGPAIRREHPEWHGAAGRRIQVVIATPRGEES